MFKTNLRRMKTSIHSVKTQKFGRPSIKSKTNQIAYLFSKKPTWMNLSNTQ